MEGWNWIRAEEAGMLVVTGATGMLGNVLARTLAERKVGPLRALVRPTSDLAPLAGLDIEVVTGDLQDVPCLVQAFTGADIVFHVGGIVSIAKGGFPRLYRANVEGTRNVLAACREAGVRRLVYCSSIHAFTAPPKGACVTEESPVDPGRSSAAYDRSKAEATLLVRQAIAEGLEAVVVYPTGVLGPYDYRPSYTGELVIQVARGRLPAYVDGAYNFVDVRDVAAGMVAAAFKGAAGEGYILAGHNVPVLELLRMIAEVTSTPVPRLHLPFGLVRSLSFLIPAYYWATRQKPLFTTYSLDVISSGCTMTNEKAERELGYRPRPFKETIEDAVRWFREQGMI
jgi:dihydroflavonol-4-reductase